MFSCSGSTANPELITSPTAEASSQKPKPTTNQRSSLFSVDPSPTMVITTPFATVVKENNLSSVSAIIDNAAISLEGHITKTLNNIE